MFTIKDQVGNIFPINLHAVASNAPIFENSYILLCSSEIEKKLYVSEKYITATNVDMRSYIESLPRIFIPKEDLIQAQFECDQYFTILDRFQHAARKEELERAKELAESTVDPQNLIAISSTATSLQPTTEQPFTIPVYVSPKP